MGISAYGEGFGTIFSVSIVEERGEYEKNNEYNENTDDMEKGVLKWQDTITERPFGKI